MKNPADKLSFRERLGKCYSLAGQYAQNSAGHVLVHGSVQGRLGGRVGPRVGHAWVMTDAGVWEPNLNALLPEDAFADLFHPEVAGAYRPPELVALLLVARHWGPWSPDEHAAAGVSI